MDYAPKLEVEFSPKMVIEMQERATCKAHRTMIRKTLRGRTMIKTL
jgi:hypothetical protein